MVDGAEPAYSNSFSFKLGKTANASVERDKFRRTMTQIVDDDDISAFFRRQGGRADSIDDEIKAAADQRPHLVVAPGKIKLYPFPRQKHFFLSYINRPCCDRVAAKSAAVQALPLCMGGYGACLKQREQKKPTVK